MDPPIEKRHVALVLFPLQGHIRPVVELGTVLHAKGFNITVLHPEFNAPNPSNHPQLDFLSFPVKLSGQEATLKDPFMFISNMNKSCSSFIKEHLVLWKGSSKGICCVVFDALMSVAESLTDELDIPSIVVRTVSAGSLLTYPVILQLQDQNKIPLPESELEKPVPSIEFLRFKDLPFSVASKIPQPLIHTLRSLSKLRSTKAVILNTVECLEEPALPALQQHYQVPLFTMGPIHKMALHHYPTTVTKQDTSCLTWLDKKAPNSVIYVSLGSIATIDKEELIETAWGLVLSKQPFLWVIRSDSVKGTKGMECLPEELAKMVEERGRVVEWAPQKEVLSHSAVGAFLSHCGWNSTLEGISEAVCMICRPCFADQLVNARYISHVWKVGFELENSRDRLVLKNAVQRALVDDEGKEIKERCLDLKQKLETSVQKGGSSYESMESLTQFILSM